MYRKLSDQYRYVSEVKSTSRRSSETSDRENSASQTPTRKKSVTLVVGPERSPDWSVVKTQFFAEEVQKPRVGRPDEAGSPTSRHPQNKFMPASSNNNALLATYFQSNYIKAGAMRNAAGNRFVMPHPHVRKPSLEFDSDEDTLSPISKGAKKVMPFGNISEGKVPKGSQQGAISHPEMPKIQRMRKVGVELPSEGYMDREEENELKFAIKTMCDATHPVTIMVTGPSGSGKSNIVSTILTSERHEVFLWYECRAEVIIWMNCLLASKFYDEDRLFDEIVELLQVEFGPIKQRTRVKIRSLLERDPTRRFMFVLDDIYNKKVADFLMSLGSTIRCLLIVRDAKEASLINYRYNIRSIPLKDLNDRQLLHILETPLKSRAPMAKLKSLPPMCQSLALLANLIKSCFTSNENDEFGRVYGSLVEALSRRSDDGVPLREPLRTTTKLIVFLLSKESLEMKWYFYSFIIFNFNQPVKAADMAVLWDVKETEAESICSHLKSRGLLISVFAVENDKVDHVGYAIHHLLFRAASDAARVGNFVEQNASEIKSKFVTPEVLQRAVLKRSERVLDRIVRDTDPITLDQLCRQKYGIYGQTFIHYLYNTKWREQHFGVYTNISAGKLVLLLNKLVKARIDTSKLLAREDGMGDCVLMTILDDANELNIDTDTQQFRLLSTLVRSIGQKMACKIAATRYWTAKFADSMQNTPLFMAALRGDYTTVDGIVRHNLSEINHKNGLGETPIMAATGTGNMAIVRLLHRVGGADLDEPDLVGNRPVLVASATGRADIIDYFLQNEAKMDVANDARRNALMLAAFGGHIDVVRCLLGTSYFYGSDVNRADRNGATALTLACLNGHVEVVAMLIKNGADIHAVDKEGNDALLAAAYGGSRDVVECLLQHGAKAEVSDFRSRTAMMKAASQGHVEVVELLYSRAANVNAPDNDMSTPIFFAVDKSNFQVVQKLVTIGAQLNTCRKNGTTVLMAATIVAKSIPIIQLLLSNGAHVNASDRDGLTALMLACIQGEADIADLLIAGGANVNSRSVNGSTAALFAVENGHFDIVKLLHSHRAQLNLAREDGVNALIIACERGYQEIAEYLTANSCSPNTCDLSGQTALMKAAINGHIDTVNHLLMAGANVNAINKEGSSALILAASSCHRKVVDALLAKNAKVGSINKSSISALIGAIQGGCLAIVEQLQLHGSDVNQRQPDGTTPIMVACHHGHLEIVRFLHSKWADINASDGQQMTPLMEASHMGHTAVVNFLLRNNANVHAEHSDGSTAIFWAVEGGHLEVTRLLHAHGALINVRKNSGVTPLMQAAYARHEAIVVFLQQNGGR